MAKRCSTFMTSMFALAMFTACAATEEGDGTSGAPSEATGGAGASAASGGGGAGNGGDGGVGGTGGSAGAAGIGGSGAIGVVGMTDAGSVTDAGVAAPIDAGSPAPIDAAVSEDAGLHESLVGCRGPSDPGCAECKEADGTYRRAEPAASWYNIYSVDGTCEPSCPACASCMYSDKAEFEQLELRPDCLPCSDEPQGDPCFDPTSCGCFCQHYERLRRVCPTLFEE